MAVPAEPVRKRPVKELCPCDKEVVGGEEDAYVHCPVLPCRDKPAWSYAEEKALPASVQEYSKQDDPYGDIGKEGEGFFYLK